MRDGQQEDGLELVRGQAPGRETPAALREGVRVLAQALMDAEVSTQLESSGLRVSLLDIDEAAVVAVNDARLLFRENLAAVPLATSVRDGLLSATCDPAVVANSSILVLSVGTSDQHNGPDLTAVRSAIGR
jgi:UDP-N-acetyl-D-mannosaminuronate dehydrogenase